MKKYTIENDYLIAEVCDYGATLTSLIVKKYDEDVVLGFNNLTKYQNEGEYMGQTIGRVANRIANGSFELSGVIYQLDINDGPNSLHGGNNGLNTREFKIVQERGQLSCFCNIEHLEDGYPGNFDVIVTYQLEGNGLNIIMEATCDRSTLCSLTNHSFFNLKGSGTIENHGAWIDADYIGEVDSNGLTLDTRLNVFNTPFNFNDPKELKSALASNHPQIVMGNGLDHNYCLNRKGYKHKASLMYKDRVMRVYTDLDHMHVYSGNYLNGQIGKDEQKYLPRSGICFETQFYPNSINYREFKRPILTRNDTYRHITRFEFS